MNTSEELVNIYMDGGRDGAVLALANPPTPQRDESTEVYERGYQDGRYAFIAAKVLEQKKSQVSQATGERAMLTKVYVLMYGTSTGIRYAVEAHVNIRECEDRLAECKGHAKYPGEKYWIDECNLFGTIHQDE